MKVMAKEEGFYGGRLRKPFDVFEFKGKKLGKWMVEADKEPETETVKKTDLEPDKGPTKKEIIAQLTLAGVECDDKMNKPELLELLKATIEKTAPASSGASDKSQDPFQ